MLSPVAASAIDLALEEQAGGVAGVLEGNEQKIHRSKAAGCRETEGREQRDRLAALLEEDGARVHRFEARELLVRSAHAEPPAGTWLKNFMPALTWIVCPGCSGSSLPCSSRTSSTYPASTPRTRINSSRLVGAARDLLDLIVQSHRHELDDTQPFGAALRKLDNVVGTKLNGLAVAFQHESPIAIHNSDAPQFGFRDFGDAPLVTHVVDREPEYPVALEGPERLAALPAEIDRLVQAHGARTWEEELNENVVFYRSEPRVVQDPPTSQLRVR